MRATLNPEQATEYWDTITSNISRWPSAEICFDVVYQQSDHQLPSKLAVEAPLLRQFHLKSDSPINGVRLFGGHTPLLQDLVLQNVSLTNWGFLATTNLRHLVPGQTPPPGPSLQVLNDILRMSSGLETLCLTDMELSNSVVPLETSTGLINLPNLKTVTLWRTNVSVLAPLLGILQLSALNHLSIVPSLFAVSDAFFIAIRQCLADRLLLEPDKCIPIRLMILQTSISLIFGRTSSQLAVEFRGFDTRALLETCLIPVLESPHNREKPVSMEMDCIGGMRQADFVQCLWRLPQVISLELYEVIAAWGNVHGLVSGLASAGRDEREGQWLLPRLKSVDVSGCEDEEVDRIQERLPTREAAHLAGGEGAPEKLLFLGW